MKILFFCFLLLLGKLVGENTVIEANRARYDGEKIYLNGAVTIENTLGKVWAESAMLLREKAGKIEFPYFELSENVCATLTNNTHIKCAKVSCDYNTLKSHFEGDPKIHYADERGEIFAKSAVVEYKENGKKIEVSKVTLSGEVQLKNKDSQYALADCVEYLPEEEILVLKGEGNSRVLFFDKLKGMELSAKRVVAHGKDSIQGMGEVSFVFNGEEFAKLKEQFEWK